MSCAIFRCKGINTLSDLSQIGSHNQRTKESYKSNTDIRKEDTINNIELVKCAKKKSQIKDCYDNNLYNDSDISYITKDTSKEKEMTLYIEEKDYEIF